MDVYNLISLWFDFSKTARIRKVASAFVLFNKTHETQFMSVQDKKQIQLKVKFNLKWLKVLLENVLKFNLETNCVYLSKHHGKHNISYYLL